MVETFFGFKKTPFGDSPDPKQLFCSQAWNQAKARLQFLADHHGTGLLTGEVGAGKSTAARSFTAGLNPNLYKVLYLHWTSGSTLDLLRQLALLLDLQPAHYRGDLVRQTPITCHLVARCVKRGTLVPIGHFIRQQFKRVVKIVQDGYLKALFLQAFDSKLLVKEFIGAHGVSLPRAECLY